MEKWEKKCKKNEKRVTQTFPLAFLIRKLAKMCDFCPFPAENGGFFAAFRHFFTTLRVDDFFFFFFFTFAMIHASFALGFLAFFFFSSVSSPYEKTKTKYPPHAAIQKHAKCGIQPRLPLILLSLLLLLLLYFFFFVCVSFFFFFSFFCDNSHSDAPIRFISLPFQTVTLFCVSLFYVYCFTCVCCVCVAVIVHWLWRVLSKDITAS
jgi:ABC-type Fe3+ transport system permease subunit